MKTSRAFFVSVAFFGCVLFVGSKILAQTQAGLLGQRYGGLSLFSEHLRDSNLSNGTGATLLVNVPVNSFLDFEASGSFESFPDYSVRDQRAFAGVTAYRDFNTFKIFALTSVGSTWQSSKINGITYRANDGIYAFGAGIEVPFTDSSALFGRVTWNRYFDDNRGHYWTYTVGANHWFNQKFGAVASVFFFEESAVTFSLGVNVRF
jgi:hypothetical protein